MRSFDDARWAPEGARPHVLIPVTPAVAEIAAAHLDYLRRWWAEQDDHRRFEQVFRPIRPQYLHATVAWIDQPTLDLPGDQLRAMVRQLQDTVRELPPLQLQVGPAIAGLYALELYIAPDPAADRLAAAVRGCLREVFGADAVPEPPPERPWRPHITVAYAQAQADTDGLCTRIAYTPAPEGGLLRPVALPVDHLLWASQDTWPEWGGGPRWVDAVLHLPLTAGRGHAAPAQSSWPVPAA